MEIPGLRPNEFGYPRDQSFFFFLVCKLRRLQRRCLGGGGCDSSILSTQETAWKPRLSSKHRPVMGTYPTDRELLRTYREHQYQRIATIILSSMVLIGATLSGMSGRRRPKAAPSSPATRYTRPFCDVRDGQLQGG